MKFDLEFEEELFKKQSDLRFKLVWSEEIRKNNKALLWVIPVSVIGILLLLFEQKLGYLFLGTGLYYFYKFYKYYSFSKEARKKYLDVVEKEIINFKNEEQKRVFWEFKEEYLRYKDFRFDVKYTWENFVGFRIVENNLFIDLDLKGNSFVLGKDELGEERFTRLVNFVKNKLKHKNKLG